MRRTLVFALPIFAVLAVPAVAHADDDKGSGDSILFKIGIGAIGEFGGNFLGKPGDKTVTVNGVTGQDTTYPGFGGTMYGGGAYLELRLLGLVGVEADFIRMSGKGSGDLTYPNGTKLTVEIQQSATHLPILAKAVLPLPLLAPYIVVGPEFVFVGSNAATVTPAGAVVDAYSDNYKFWTFGFGVEIKLPLPGIDLRIPVSIRGSVNPGVSDKITDRYHSDAAGTHINAQWQYQAYGTVGFGAYF